MKHPFTTTLAEWAIQFLVTEAKEKKVNKNEILEAALKMYRKAKLKKEVERGLKERQEEYRQIAAEFANANLNRLKNL